MELIQIAAGFSTVVEMTILVLFLRLHINFAYPSQKFEDAVQPGLNVFYLSLETDYRTAVLLAR